MELECFQYEATSRENYYLLRTVHSLYEPPMPGPYSAFSITSNIQPSLLRFDFVGPRNHNTVLVQASITRRAVRPDVVLKAVVVLLRDDVLLA